MTESNPSRHLRKVRKAAEHAKHERPIRSYVLAPYRMVRDECSGQTWDNPDAVLGGNLDDILRAALAVRTRI